MSLRYRLKIQSIAIAIALVFFLIALSFCAVALFYNFSQYFSVDVSALLTAAVYLILVLIALSFARLFSLLDRRQCGPLHRTKRHNPLEAALQDSLDPEIRDWVKQNPGRSLTLTLLAGMVLGSSNDARDLLKKYCERYFNEH